jgi:SAM-dependent methyltransferase
VGVGESAVEDVVEPQSIAVPGPRQGAPACRLCRAPLEHTFVDLGLSPLANAYLEQEDLAGPELFFPLRVYVCSQCLFVQLPEAATPAEIFSDYAYFSSYSESWLEHARSYVEQISERFGIGAESLVVELASNDGYLLRFFQERGVDVLGVEPAANVAKAATDRGVPTVVEFFGADVGARLAGERSADLIVGNNVLAHVPDAHDFVEGIRRLLAPSGLLTMEFPHLLKLIAERQFDTIYHEHYSYFALATAQKLFEAHGLRVFDVEQLPTHGGSLRIFACHDPSERPTSFHVDEVLELERSAGLLELAGYAGFGEEAQTVKRDLLAFLIEAMRDGKRVAAYGAAAKGNTLLNFCGVRADFVECVVDRSPHKQHRYLPGTRIPILPPEALDELRPDFLLILPWNLRDEIVTQMSHVRSWGCRFVVPVPELTVLA